MRGIGEQYKTLIELAAQRTGLSTEQIKVMITVQNLLTLIILLSVDEAVMSNMYKNYYNENYLMNENGYTKYVNKPGG